MFKTTVTNEIIKTKTSNNIVDVDIANHLPSFYYYISAKFSLELWNMNTSLTLFILAYILKKSIFWQKARFGSIIFIQ